MTSTFLGAPDFPDCPIPSWEDFCSYYGAGYFGSADELVGRCYVILAGDREVGMIAHRRIDLPRKQTELNIWLRSREDCGKGYGSEALRRLCGYVHDKYGVRSFILRPSARTSRAIVVCRKAGFEPLTLSREDEIGFFGPGYYADSVVFQKRMVVDGCESVG